MTFSFLNPWLWFGALAVAAPLWLHLRRKKERRLVRFSAVRFLEDQPRARSTPLQVQNIGLLLLRVMAVLLIAAAFAWPYIRRPSGAPIKESVVYILDNTLSHQANDGFKTDRDTLLRDLSASGPDVQVAVVELTSTPRVLATFRDDCALVRRKVQELQPSFQRGSYLAGFRQANSLLENALGEHKRIVLLGDNQLNQWNENSNSPPFLRGVQIDLPKPGPALLPNLWVSDLRAQRVFLGDKSIINFSVRLGHLGPAPIARVVVQINNRAVLDRTVELANQPESILLQGQTEAEPASWLRMEASVEGAPDSLPADNHVFCCLAPVVEGKVAVLAQSPYLRLALSPEVMRGQWLTRMLDPASLADDAHESQNAEVLCLESAYLQNPDTRTLVKRYLAQGRGVFLIVNQLSPAVDGCLRELGFQPEGMTTETNSAKFQFVSSNHPVFHAFQSPDFGNLMSVEVYRYAQLRAVAARPLIFSTTGDGLFFEGTKFPGKLFVCAFGLEREQTSWPVELTFIPFIDLVLQAARAQDPTPTTFQPAELTSIPMPAGVVAHEIVLSQSGHELRRASVAQNRAQLLLPDKPGLYAMTIDDRPELLKMFSVNPSPKESELTFVDAPKTLKGWCLEDHGQPRQGPSLTDDGLGLLARLRQRLWWWMVLGGLLALGLETALAEMKGAAVES